MTPTPHQPDSSNRFTKKPVTIEAFQFARRNNGPVGQPDWFHDAVTRNDVILHNTGKWNDATQPAYCEIRTLEGVMRAEEGDWIIRGIKGEIYPCKPHIFAATYSPEAKQPDSSIDIEALRKAAEAATAGPWMRLFGDRTVYDRMNDGCRGMTIASADYPPSQRDSNNLDYIAAANPATIIALLNERDALLDRLERAEADAKHYSMGADAEAKSADEWRERALRAESAAGAVPEGSITGDEVTALAHKLISDLKAEFDGLDEEALNYCARGVGSLNSDILTFIKNRAAAPKASPLDQYMQASIELDVATNNFYGQAAPSQQAEAAPMTSESNDALIELARYWKLDGDWMTCKGCKRSLIASRDGEELNHADGCKFSDQHHPWAKLRAIVTGRAIANSGRAE